MHACDLASELGIDTILIPRLPGVLSALGLAIADVKTELIQSINRSIDDVSLQSLRSIFEGLESHCAKRIDEQGLASQSREFAWVADIRYPGQTFDISVPVYRTDFQDGPSELIERFHGLHDNLYDYSIRSQSPFLVNAQVTGIAKLSDYSLPQVAQATSEVPARTRRTTMMEGIEKQLDAGVYSRSDLLAGHRLEGPALVDQEDSTVMVLPGWRGVVDQFGNLVLRKG